MSNKVDLWTWSESCFAEWRKHVNDRFAGLYLVTLADLGVDDEVLRSHWNEKQAPYEFVEWFAIKYDLDPITSFGGQLRNRQ